MSHESFHSENLDIVREILFINHYPQYLIEKDIKIRIEQVKTRQGSNVDMDTQNKVFDEHNTIVLPYFGQISKTIQFMFKIFKIYTISRIPFKVETLITLGKDLLNGFEKSGAVYKLICKKCEMTDVEQTSELLNTGVEHKKNLG